MEANYDDILAAAQQQGEQGFDVDAWAEKKQSERDEVYALRDRMTRYPWMETNSSSILTSRAVSADIPWEMSC